MGADPRFSMGFARASIVGVLCLLSACGSAETYEGEWVDGKRHGKWTLWYGNGVRMSEGEFWEGKPIGKWTYWHENGARLREGEYTGGLEEGEWTTWYETARKKEQGPYRAGRRHGTRPWPGWCTRRRPS